MATHTRVSERVARLVENAIDRFIPDEEAVRWDVAVVPVDPENPTVPNIVIWLGLDEGSDLTLESTLVVDFYDDDLALTIPDHVRKAWETCLVERMEEHFLAE